MDFKLYCDESRHILSDKLNKFMVIGAIRIPAEYQRKIEAEIKRLKYKYKYFSEIKWRKVSYNNKNFYLDLITYFFSNDFIDFRCIVINKEKIKNNIFSQTNQVFFYKMYFLLLKAKVKRFSSNFFIYIDEKDCHAHKYCIKLQEYLKNKVHNFINKINIFISPIASKDAILVQLTDLFIGAVGYQFNNFYQNRGKIEICKNLCLKLGIESLCTPKEKFNKKFDIFRINLK